MTINGHSFNSPVIGIDPISKGSFEITSAVPWYTEDWIAQKEATYYQGMLLINSDPLYKIAKESPLRLQGLIASVTFGTEKHFLKVEQIEGYTEETPGSIKLAVKFSLLQNLDYLENIADYKWNNLLP